ncbi:MAG: hypothetical protein WBX11_03225 [Thiobacillaceae bacterium]
MANLLPPLRPLAFKEWLWILCIEYGDPETLDSALAMVEKTGGRTHILVGGVVCRMLKPRAGVA